MGYSGVALKACKGQSHAMLMAAAAQKFGMFLCVQDLTCPGASLVHSAGIAARVPGNAGIEANARQFVPSASAAWEPRFPGVFTIGDGVMRTGHSHRPRPGGGAAGTAADGSLTPASRTPLTRSERRAIERRAEKRQIAPRRLDCSLLALSRRRAGNGVFSRCSEIGPLNRVRASAPVNSGPVDHAVAELAAAGSRA